MSKNKNAIVGLFIIIVIIIAVVIFSKNSSSSKSAIPVSSSGVIQVVAAENFWGSIASQIGGTHVNVLSIVSDPNADPHEYESNTTDARAVADADYVIVNGAGYDSWMDKLLSAGASNPKR